MKTNLRILSMVNAAVLLCGLGTATVSPQPVIPPAASVYQPLSDQQLDQLLGPIALYPDPLLGEILPAATFPAQIVMADRYISGGGDPNLTAQQPWDASVLALAHYPTVLQYMDENLAWTTEVGEVFLNQQQQVMESIQRLRLGQNFGNLQSTPQQQVVDDNGCVEILPADQDEIYVPDYQPNYVYCQSGFGPGFGYGCAAGPWLNCEFDWVHHNLRYWGSYQRRPQGWWHERADQRQALASETTPWHQVNQRGFGGAGRNERGVNNWAVNRTAPTDFQTRLALAHERQSLFQQQFQQRLQQFQQQHNFARFNQQRPASVFFRQANGAFVGNAGPRLFSGSGQHSAPTFTHSAPVQVHSAPVSHASSGGGGGSHGGARR